MVSRTWLLFALCAVCLSAAIDPDRPAAPRKWIERPHDQWPQITMINTIEYVDTTYSVVGCAFLLDTGDDTLAVTAKHLLTPYKSGKMNSVSFANTLKSWRMYPKNNPADVVIVDQLLNEDPNESITFVPTVSDWLLFSIREMSPNIEPLRIRSDTLALGEQVYIVGWRYADKEGPQRVYQGRLELSRRGVLFVSTVDLADNRTPGLSGSPVIDAGGRLVGIVSKKHGALEEVSPIDYPLRLLGEMTPPG